LSNYPELTYVVKEIEKLKQEREAYVAAGRCESLEEYRRVCGVVQGLNYAENIIRPCAKTGES